MLFLTQINGGVSQGIPYFFILLHILEKQKLKSTAIDHDLGQQVV